jgi:hypothetical protein
MGYPGRSSVSIAVGACALLWCGHGRAEPTAASSFSGLTADREAASSRVCIDMDSHFFEWKWGNVPFASSCIEAQSVRKASTVPETEACYFDCSNTSLGCLTSVLDGHEPKACIDDLAACMSRCKGGSDATIRDWLGDAP